MSEREKVLGKPKEEEPEVEAHKVLKPSRGEGEAPEGQGERREGEDEEPDVEAHKFLHKGG
jgi:hypothetical protein